MSMIIDVGFAVLILPAILYYIGAVYHLDKDLIIRVGRLRSYTNKLIRAAASIVILAVLFVIHKLIADRIGIEVLLVAMGGLGVALSSALRWRAAQRVFSDHSDDEVVPCSLYR